MNGVWGLRDFSLELTTGVLGLLGPNGAGKSTLMNTLSTVTRPSSGTIEWNGIDIMQKPDSLRAVLGYLPQNFGVYPNLNAVEFLEYLAAVKGLRGRSVRQRIDDLLNVVNLTAVRKQALGSFSGGMRQRVGIAQALLNDPQVLIVDEPTAGLDPEERIRFRNLLAELSTNRIIILSTHIVSDVESIASSIALMAGGSLISRASPEKLLACAEGKIWNWAVKSEDLARIREQYQISSTSYHPDGIHVRLVSDSAPVGATPVAPNLEDAYLYLLSNHKRAFVA
jgi:ABC-type multidrug transport system ATPase subunit